ncbi:DAO-domain-containing protein [Aspergillus campestris IBT 28561]|uniref:DAO-domain-containing protein n=1 Tax=Aspergillus campestris (strain IBT 28561) TaxID=1392248 RepID=A0A2I1CW12_ASPC2|nr:DAO-domain-containing protein [Aspergillus campestris IBT 28561]PKY01795.1 DAO-domain-containing protein [Aspergillus campestris IBT 28561]
MGQILSRLRNAYHDIQAVLAELSTTARQFEALLSRISQRTFPPPNPTISFWQQNPPFPNLVSIASATLPAHADIVIIGSGISGASIAYTILTARSRSNDLKHHPPRVVMLEARNVCSGATGRNGGHIKHSAYTDYAGLKKQFGKTRAKSVLQFGRRHLPTLLELTRERKDLEIAEAREVETVDIFTDRDMWAKTKKMVEELRREVPEAGDEISVYEGAEGCEKYNVGVDHCVGIITYPAGAMWPYRFVTALLSGLLADYSESFAIETNTPVTEVQTSPTGAGHAYTIYTPRGHISATQVIHATDAFASNLIPGLTGKLFPVRGHMSAQTPGTQFPGLNGARSWGIIGNRGFDYITQRPAAGGGQLMVGGGMVQSPERGIDEFGIWGDNRLSYPVRAYLEGLMPAVFGEKNWGQDADGGRMKHVWSGSMGFTVDLLPYVGRLDPKLTGRKLSKRSRWDGSRSAGEWISAGFQGEGMVLAWLSGVAVGLMAMGMDKVDMDARPGMPEGKVSDWLPRELLCSRQRVERGSVSQLATML